MTVPEASARVEFVSRGTVRAIAPERSGTASSGGVNRAQHRLNGVLAVALMVIVALAPLPLGAVLQQRAAHAARAAQQLDPEELRVLQRFYDQLCALVEAQRMSDPLSLMVVHKVKSLLEEGTFLQRVMFEAVIGHLGKFCSSTGIHKYNK